MKNSDRIPTILKKIEKIWLNNSDLRLCQLIQNCFGKEDIYYIEDKELIKILKANYDRE